MLVFVLVRRLLRVSALRFVVFNVLLVLVGVLLLLLELPLAVEVTLRVAVPVTV